MKLIELIHPKAITVDMSAQDKDTAMDELVGLLENSGGIKKGEKEATLGRLKERESLGSTGIGKGVGIPHAKCNTVKKMVAAIGISKNGVDFKSLDGEPTYIFFLLIAPGGNPGPHLKALAKISRLLDDKFIRDRLRSVKSSQELFDLIKKEEQKSGN